MMMMMTVVMVQHMYVNYSFLSLYRVPYTLQDQTRVGAEMRETVLLAGQSVGM